MQRSECQTSNPGDGTIDAFRQIIQAEEAGELATPEYLGDAIAMIDICWALSPIEFNERLRAWLTKTGMDCEPYATMTELVTFINGPRLKSLGLVLEMALDAALRGKAPDSDDYDAGLMLAAWDAQPEPKEITIDVEVMR